MEKTIHTPAYARLLEQLRAVRKAAGLSQRDLAARLNVTPSWVAKIEIGERRVDLIEFTRIVEACDADAIAVFRRIIAPHSRTPRNLQARTN